MGLRKQSDTTYPLFFMLISSSDHITGLTGKSGSVVVSLSKNGAGGGVPAGAISEVDATNHPGLYKIADNATDSNTLGVLNIHAKDAASDPMDCKYDIVNYDPFTFLPSVNVSQWNGTNVATPATAGYPVVTHKVGTGIGELQIASGVVQSNMMQILSSVITGTAAQIVAAFTKWFNVATPTGTVNSIPDAVAGASGGLPTTNGTKVLQTVDLTAGQSIACSDKTGFSLSTDGLKAIWDFLTADVTVVIASFGNLFKTNLNAKVGDAVDTVNSGTHGNAQLLSAIQNVQNGTFIVAAIPQILERPDAGSTTISISVVFYDETGAAKNLDSGNPTMTLVNDAGTDLSGRLGSWTNPATGKYLIDYTNTSTDVIEGLHWDITGTINSKLRRWVAFTQLTDTTAVDFTTDDRNKLTLITGTYGAKVDSRDVNGNLPAQVKVLDDIDFSTTMKTSLNNATPTVTVNATSIKAFWDYLTADVTAVIASFGNLFKTNVNETISSRSSHTAADVWTVTTRTLSSFGTLVADIATAVWGATTRTLSAFGFTVATNSDSNVASIKGVTDQFRFTVTNQVDANTLTGGIDAEGIREALGMEEANMDEQFDAIPTVSENQSGIAKTTDVTASTNTIMNAIDDIPTVAENQEGLAKTTDVTSAQAAIETAIDDAEAAIIAKIEEESEGAGIIPWTYTLTNSITGLPIADAQVWISTDSDGQNIIASGDTDMYGQKTFNLSEGTVYIWRKKAGFNFNDPDMEIITEDTPAGGDGSPVVIPLDYTLTNDVTLEPIEGATVYVSTDSIGNNVIATGETDSNGLVSFDLYEGTFYLWRSKTGFTFTNPDTEVLS
jgi:hypothetical protein